MLTPVRFDERLTGIADHRHPKTELANVLGNRRVTVSRVRKHECELDTTRLELTLQRDDVGRVAVGDRTVDGREDEDVCFESWRDAERIRLRSGLRHPSQDTSEGQETRSTAASGL